MRFFAGKNLPAAKHGEQRANICGASRPANTPRQACSLDCIAKLRFAFSANIIPSFANPCRQNSKPIRKNNHKKKEAEASLGKSTARTCLQLLHSVLQSRSFCWYIPHTKTRPAAGTSWRNISFHQNVRKICRHHSLH